MGALVLLFALLPLHVSWAGITNTGPAYTINCSAEAPSTVLSQTLTTSTSYTVTIDTCAFYLTSGSGVSPSGNDYIGTTPTVFTVPAGFVGFVKGYQAGQPPASVDITLNFVAPPNEAPVFVGTETSLMVAQSASATDITSLLHASDSDAGQTLTWTQFAAPSHGTLNFAGATASSGSTDIAPGGTITYTPTASYVGSDSFSVRVSDGASAATRVINVTVGPAPTVAVNALTLNGMTVGTVFVTQSFTANGGYGDYTYSVSAGSLPDGLLLSPEGVLTGTPSTAGAYNFTVRATDSSTGSGPYSGTLAFSGTVAAPFIDGVCATIAATAFAPSTGLCTQGTAPSSATDGSPWTWVCTGSGGGATASCSAPNAATATDSGTGRATISGDTWAADAASSGFVATSTVPSLPPGYTFPHGLLNLNLTSGSAGSTATVVITYPSALPEGTVYWKYGRTASNPTAHWYQFPGAVIAGNTVTLSLTDGADGDDDMTANGLITDPGGPGIPSGIGGTVAIPTLSEWGMILLSSLIAMFGIVQVRRRKSAAL